MAPGTAPAATLAPAELALRIALLPPISRGVFAMEAARQFSAQLIELWRKVDDDVALGGVYRLLDAETVAGVVLRILAETEGTDPRYWTLPDLDALLPALRAEAWEEIMAGRLLVEAVKAGQHQTLAPVLLRQLVPDWQWSSVGEFTDARVRRLPETGRVAEAGVISGNLSVALDAVTSSAAGTVAAKQKRPSWLSLRSAIKVAVGNIVEAHREPLPFNEFWPALNDALGQHVPRSIARKAQKTFVPPELCLQRGYHSKIKSPNRQIKSPS
jgi:hypothetical protein